jgi:hypothetical protein
LLKASTHFFTTIIDKNWKFNLNYWTSGKKIKGGTGFEFCIQKSNGNGKEKPATPSPIASYWAKGQPNNTAQELCVIVNINKYVNEPQLHDRSCYHRYVFGCQVTNILQFNES